jgi:alkylation response protein AidB-like acyl-CoA dehydrogenase
LTRVRIAKNGFDQKYTFKIHRFLLDCPKTDRKFPKTEGRVKIMFLELTEEQKIFKETLRKFCEKELAPKASEWDEKQEFPWENVHKMKKLGLWGLTIPEKYGGSGADMVTYVTAVIEVARVCASTAVLFFEHNGAPTKLIAAVGTEEQKEKYLPPLSRGDKFIGWGQTEPGAGSDATAMKTSGDLQGDHYILNGTKVFCTSGEVADVYIVLARTDPNAIKKSRGISYFIVEKGCPGFTIGKKENKMGMRGSPTTELIFDNCQVPTENILLKHPDAFGRVMHLMNGERLGNSASCIGSAEAAFEYSIKYVQQREAFRKKVSEFQGIQWMLADMAIQIETAKLLLYESAHMVDKGLPVIKESCMTKIVSNEISQKVCNMAMQLLGAYGYMKDYPVERHYRDCRGLGFGGGTPQVLRGVLANQLIKTYPSS